MSGVAKRQPRDGDGPSTQRAAAELKRNYWPEPETPNLMDQFSPRHDPKENAAAAMSVACSGRLNNDDDCTVRAFRYANNSDLAVIDINNSNVDGSHAQRDDGIL